MVSEIAPWRPEKTRYIGRDSWKAADPRSTEGSQTVGHQSFRSNIGINMQCSWPHMHKGCLWRNSRPEGVHNSRNGVVLSVHNRAQTSTAALVATDGDHFGAEAANLPQPLDSHRRYHGHERGRLGSSFQHNRGQLQLVQFLLGALQCHPHVRGHMLNSLAEIQSWMNETQNARTLSVKRAQKVLDKNRADRRWPQLCCCFHCAWPQADQSLAFSISI